MLAASAWLLYTRSLWIPYFADDYVLLFDKPKQYVGYFWTHPIPDTYFYRPLQGTFSALMQAQFGFNPFWLHAVHMALFGALVVVVFCASLTLGLSLRGAIIAGILFFSSQSNVFAVASCDQFSHLTATLFSFTGLWLLFRSLIRNGSRDAAASGRLLRLLSLCSLCIAVFAKESALASFILALGIVVYAARIRKPDDSVVNSVKGGFITFAPYLAVAVFFLIMRFNAVPTMHTAPPGERYSVHLGSNVLVNIGLLMFSALQSVSSVFIALSAKSRNVPMLLVAVLPMLGLALVALLGTRQLLHKQRRLVFSLIGCAIISMFPMALLNHVSELCTYSIGPFVCIALGASTAALVDVRENNRKLQRWVCLSVLAVWIATGIFSVTSKIELMRASGERCETLLEQVSNYARHLPSNTHIVLRNLPAKATDYEYSIYKLRDFNVIEWGVNAVGLRSQRADITAEVVEWEQQPSISDGSSELWLTLDINGNVVIDD